MTGSGWNLVDLSFKALGLVVPIQEWNGVLVMGYYQLEVSVITKYVVGPSNEPVTDSVSSALKGFEDMDDDVQDPSKSRRLNTYQGSRCILGDNWRTRK